MLDGGRIIGGVAIALAVVAGPAWLGSTRGARIDALATPKAGERCILPQLEMRRNHPGLLADWRERVVRSGERAQREKDGRVVRISLTGTCLGCHGNAAEFCDRCHARAAVTLSCWQCHEKSAR